MAHPHFLKNRLNKEQALARLASEDFKRRTFSFYRYVKIIDQSKPEMNFLLDGKNLGL